MVMGNPYIYMEYRIYSTLMYFNVLVQQTNLVAKTTLESPSPPPPTATLDEAQVLL